MTAGIITVLCLMTLVRSGCQAPKEEVEMLPSASKVSDSDGEEVRKLSFFASVKQVLSLNKGNADIKKLQQEPSGFEIFEANMVSLIKKDSLYIRSQFDYLSSYKVSQNMQKLVVDSPSLKAPMIKCEHTPTMVNGKRSCKQQLIFDEQFDGINPTRWQIENKFSGEPDYEFVIYQNNLENLFTANGMMHILPTLVDQRLGPKSVLSHTEYGMGDNCTGTPDSLECAQRPKAWMILPPTFSSQITTKQRFSFVYGTIEIRAKLPEGDWIYPQLYLRSKNDYYRQKYNFGLLQIVFSPGNVKCNDVLSGGYIFGDSVFSRNYGVRTARYTEGWSRDFHTFKMEWRPDGVTLSVDNEIYGNIQPPGGGIFSEDELSMNRSKKESVMSPFDEEMYLTIGVGVGGFSFENTKCPHQPWDNGDPKAQLNFYKATDQWYSTWNNDSRLVVDYVKIWAL